jgi:hypothetical protein
MHPRLQLRRPESLPLGDNDIDSSRLFDILDVDEYQAALRARVEEAQLADEATFWNALLG